VLVGLCNAGSVFCEAGNKFIYIYIYILWHVDPLLGNDREIKNYVTAVTSQRPVKSNRRTVFSVRSVLRCYKQDKLGIELLSWLVGELVRGQLGFSRFELLLLEGGS
jgi:hypothetical protein